MTDDGVREPAATCPVDGLPGGYEPPTIQRLGTLEELTLGGVTGPDDGLMGAGDEGSV